MSRGSPDDDAWARASARAAIYRAELERARELGPEYAHHWAIARRLVEDGFADPPTDRGFVALAQQIASGVKPDASPAQRASLEGFWRWYLLAEHHVHRLCEALEYFEREEHKALAGEMLAHAHSITQRMDGWRDMGDLPWLPARPPHGRTIREALGRALARYGSA